MNIEIWKDIEGFKGFYQVSNLGRIRSLDRIIKYSNGTLHNQHGKILSCFINNSGYIAVDLYGGNKKREKHYVHRLVAKAFVPNPNNKSEVNHIDEDKTNNNFLNLEWCTSSENKLSGTCVERANKTRKNKRVGEKRVLQYDLNMKLIKEYNNIQQAVCETGCNRKNIYNSCHNKVSPKKYIWKFA